MDTVTVVAVSTVAALGFAWLATLGERVPAALPVVPALFGTAIVSGAVASYLLGVWARAMDDDRLRWLAWACGLAALAMLAQYANSPPIVSGGRLPQGSSSGEALYIASHLTVPMFAIVSVCAWGRRRWARPAMVAFLVAVVAYCSWDSALLPRLVRADGTSTQSLVWALGALALLSLCSAVVWSRTAGRTATWPEAWIAVSLTFGVWDAAFHALTGMGLTGLWWAGLSMRLAQFSVLAGGLLVGFVSLLRAPESPSVSVVDSAVGDGRSSGGAMGGSEEWQRLPHDAGRMGTWSWDIGADAVHWSPGTSELLGLGPSEFDGTIDAFMQRVHPDDRNFVGKAVQDALAGVADYNIEFRIVWPAGDLHWAGAVAKVHRDATGAPRRMVGVVIDITNRRVTGRALDYQSAHDPLTNLPNRVLFLDRLRGALSRLERRPSTLAVLLLDLDRFKVVNDSLGHEVGDRVLAAVARRLRTAVRTQDTVARSAGDQFMVLCDELDGPADAVDVAERMLAALADPVEVDAEDVALSASTGIALSTGPGDSPAALLRDAEDAMYQAKKQGRGRCQVFDDELRADVSRRLDTQRALGRAVERGELELHYQPKVTVADGRLDGFEALLRWHHPERGLVPPMEFVPLAEETGLIVPIGEWALGEACRQLVSWRQAHPDRLSLRMCVNVSPRQFDDGGLHRVVERVLASTGADPADLWLEITESVLAEDPASTITALEALKKLGVGLAIDDFGTGYSSLSYLKRFPVDAVKIDRTFVAGLGADPQDSAIVAAVVRMASVLGLTVVAEGVETREQLAELRALGCELAQGWYFGRPLPAPAAGAVLARDTRVGVPQP